MKTLISAAALLLALTACGDDGDEPGASESAPTTTEAGETCDPEDAPAGFSLSWDDESLTLNGVARSEDDVAVVAIDCIVKVLDGPASIGSRIADTNDVDSPQSESWDGFEANWVFTLESDLNFTIDAK